MASSSPSWRARCLLFTLLLLLSFLSLPSSAQSNATSMEVDLISPVANGHYRVNSDRGLAVLVAIQNRHLGDPAGWLFEWTATLRTPGAKFFAVSGGVSSSGTNIHASVTHPLNQTSDPYLALSHPYLSPVTDKPHRDQTPPGEYEFTWNFQIGPWCEVLTVPRSREYASNHFISRGSFNFTIGDDAPWPTLTRTGEECASVAGQVSFTAYNTIVPAWNTLYDGPMGPCAMTASVTDAPAPCRATINAEQAAKVSSVMTWADGPTATPSLGGRLGGSLWWAVVLSALVLVQ